MRFPRVMTKVRVLANGGIAICDDSLDGQQKSLGPASRHSSVRDAGTRLGVDCFCKGVAGCETMIQKPAIHLYDTRGCIKKSLSHLVSKRV